MVPILKINLRALSASFNVGTRITYVSVAGLETYGRGFWKLQQLQNSWLVYFKFFAFADARFVSVFGELFMLNSH